MLDERKQLELDELIHKLVDGDIGPFEFQRLNDMLMHDKDAQRRYLHHTDMVNTIRWQLTGEAMQQSLSVLKTVRESAPPTTEEVKPEESRIRRRRFTFRFPTIDVRVVAAAAVVLAVTLIGLLIASGMRTVDRIHSSQDLVFRLPVPPVDLPVALVPTIEQHAGDVQVLQPGPAGQAHQVVHAAEIATPVQQGQTVTTRGRESSTRLAYPDKTSIILGNDTTFTLEKANHKRVALGVGSLAANVAPQPASKPMIIVTPHAEIQVVGTRFSIETEPNRTKLSVTEGKVRIRLVRQDDGQWIEVPAGNYAFAEPAKPVFVAAIPKLPQTWSENFAKSRPASWDRGLWIKDGPKGSPGSLRAERIDDGGEPYFQIGSQMKRSDGEGLFQIHPNTHIHLLVKIEREDWINIYLATRSAGPVPEYSNFLFKDLHKFIRKHTWYEVTIPIHAFQRHQDVTDFPQPKDLPIQFVLSSFKVDRGLSLNKIWITQGGPGQIVAKPIK